MTAGKDLESGIDFFPLCGNQFSMRAHFRHCTKLIFVLNSIGSTTIAKIILYFRDIEHPSKPRLVMKLVQVYALATYFQSRGICIQGRYFTFNCFCLYLCCRKLAGFLSENIHPQKIKIF